ncbi:hypothetical protein DBIPINDM_008488 (plasmid) [Mesorhizobium sp. AR02]|uniref:hypothetical protein n=1 Tax=Mesorhizobium sp. AR02 TaxID=2865837 RepID=UPI002160E97D|nr:hypothetical protein [Mesorhizobium sp. AR02]UVK57317.1 hypothetical protein DBIPINDM_008488 [Mesorhizobium sp. AR02]
MGRHAVLYGRLYRPRRQERPTGIAHKGEYVFDQDAVNDRCGHLQRLQRGYAAGGLVGGIGAPSMPRIQSPANQNSPVLLTFAPVIDARGAQMGAGEEIAAAVKALNSEWTVNTIKALREAKLRGMV